MGDGLVGVLSLSCKNGSTFGTESDWKSSILLVSTNDLGAVLQHDGRSYAEMRIGRIAVVGGKHRLADKLLLIVGELVELAEESL